MFLYKGIGVQVDCQTFIVCFVVDYMVFVNVKPLTSNCLVIHFGCGTLMGTNTVPWLIVFIMIMKLFVFSISCFQKL